MRKRKEVELDLGDMEGKIVTAVLSTGPRSRWEEHTKFETYRLIRPREAEGEKGLGSNKYLYSA